MAEGSGQSGRSDASGSWAAWGLPGGGGAGIVDAAATVLPNRYKPTIGPIAGRLKADRPKETILTQPPPDDTPPAGEAQGDCSSPAPPSPGRPSPGSAPHARRLWCAGASSARPGEALELDDAEARHAVKVLRLEPGDPVELIDGNGGVAEGTIADVGGGAGSVGSRGRAGRGGKASTGGKGPRGPVVCGVSAVRRVARPSPTLRLAVAPPKGPRLEAMVNQLVQLGVDDLVLTATARGVASPRGGKLERLERAAIEASKQCGRAWGMAVRGPVAWPAALAEDGAFGGDASRGDAVRLIALPEAPPRHDLMDALAGASAAMVLVGPEGGFTADERASAEAAGYRPWGLGRRVLRIETAATAAAAVLGWLRQAAADAG